MTHKLPLIAALAATLATPLAAPAMAQDMSDMLNPRGMIAELGLGQIMADRRGGVIVAPRVAEVAPAEIASLRLDTTVLSSPRPRLRPASLTAAAAPHADVPNLLSVSPEAPIASDVRAMIADMDVAAASAPAGANTLVVSGGDTVAVSGTNTAVFSSDGPAPRLTLWQRIFGR